MLVKTVEDERQGGSATSEYAEDALIRDSDLSGG